MTTTIRNEIDIEATPAEVWDVLADLDRLAEYDPVVVTSTILGDRPSGLGARRRCEVKPRRWFHEEVTIWEPHERVQFTIIECNLPTDNLTHSYTLTPTPTGTNVEQVMKYEMRLGLLGRALNTLIIRRKSDQGVKKFFRGLQDHVEARRAVMPETPPH